MKRHDFAELTDYEFEALSRDLLSRALDVRLELFTPGPDKGIDLRHLAPRGKGNPSLVVQCKHYAAHAWSELSASVKKEKPKLDKLKPKRYVLVTSVQLTPGRKDILVSLLSPHVRNASDVLGRDDLNGLLAEFPDVERRHIKLWLTGTEVLDALLNSDVANRSEAIAERTRRQLRLWVPNPSFERAKSMMEEHHLVLVAGKPGIGKTMLADVLSADFVARGWELIAISADISEGLRTWRSDRRQIFYYDDFLGQVSAGELSLRKNEDNDLAMFIARVISSPTKRLILTTREYILAQARSRYERLNSQPFTMWQCVLSLDDYTRFIRAQILYNHLYFSDLPRELKASVLTDKTYRKIIDHRRYLPRLIEQAIELPHVRGLTEAQFPKHLLQMLDDPSQIWGPIYENLPAVARETLLALAVLPSEVLLEDLLAATEALIGRSVDSVSWNASLRTLDGTFLRLEMNGQERKHERVAGFRDPSVRDYLRSRIQGDAREAARLVGRSIFFEQGRLVEDILRSIPAGERGAGATPRSVVERVLELLASPDPTLTRFQSGPEWDKDHWLERRRGPHLERRLRILLETAGKDSELVQTVLSSTPEVLSGWGLHRGDKGEAIALLERLDRCEIDTEPFYQAALAWFEETLDSSEDWQHLLRLGDRLPVGALDLSTLAIEFKSFVDSETNWLLWDLDDPEWLDQEFDRISSVADELAVDLARLPEQVRERHDELLRELPDEDDHDDHRSSAFEEGSDSDVDDLFESLRGD